MSDTDVDNEAQKPKDVFSTLVAVGDCLYLKGVYNKAIDSYTAALSMKPDDKTCLVGRSKCYLRMGQFENALKDAEASLKEDKTFFKGLYQKAEALYYMGKFEFALVFYHRGQKLRPLMQEFKLGIQKAEGAIENSVGSPSSMKLEIKNEDTTKMEQPVTATQHLTTEKKQRNQKIPKSEKTTKKLLGEFYSDKKFLENLLNNEDLTKSKSKGGERLQDVIQSCLTSLDTCTKFLSQKKPICSPEGQRKQKSTKPHRSPSYDLVPFLLKSLDEIDAELTSGNAEGSLKKAVEVMNIVQGWSEKDMPDKKEVMGSLHSCIGNALFDLGDLDKALEHHQKDLELASGCKLSEAMSRALDNIGQIYAQIGQYNQAIGFWEKKIPLVCDGLEKTWLLHNIGCCYLELERYNEARDYGINSVTAADEIADLKWQINANVLVAQSELKLRNFETSVSHFERALTQARLQDDHSAVNAIQKALDEAKQHLQK
ncbi:outer dynein arm-docking complex subunit 4 [Cheilinus undulatus]|uniref:outer dynein arm-docking complex subunit 4 n=1 Tax=Cheilinus undulatus TaxID=241271 RepID=UPI001BD3E5B1|nr:outer dynein arm-docking complex subunit 4 [Cheilinus undulatus]